MTGSHRIIEKIIQQYICIHNTDWGQGNQNSRHELGTKTDSLQERNQAIKVERKCKTLSLRKQNSQCLNFGKTKYPQLFQMEKKKKTTNHVTGKEKQRQCRLEHQRKGTFTCYETERERREERKEEMGKSRKEGSRYQVTCVCPFTPATLVLTGAVGYH